jgi:cholesterol oxidase
MATGDSSADPFDAVVVGSGFGGSVMTYRLAEKKLNVCLLERGKKWPPGSFPRTPFQFSQALWDPNEGRYGLFDVWSFAGLGALISSGLGGGSLIYCNVMLRKDAHWFAEVESDGTRRWPITLEDLEPHYKAVAPFLKPVEYPPHYRDTLKTHAFYEAAKKRGLDPFYPPLAVTFAPSKDATGTPFDTPEQNLHNAQRYTCRLVGECNAGCNFGSKNTLDFTYLSAAAELGATIRCCNEVKRFEPCEGMYRIVVADHSNAVAADQANAAEGRRTSTPPEWRALFTRRLILSAGALGTPYLLLINRSAFPKLSPCLGTRFSGNGDFLTFAVRSPKPLEPAVGPVITTSVRVADTLDDPPGEGPGHYVQDGGYPDFLATVAQMLALPRVAWAGRRTGLKVLWGKVTGRPDTHLSAEVADLLGEPRLTAGTLPLLGMGREEPQGRMRLRNGLLDVEWSFDRAKPYFDHVRETMRAIADGLEAELDDNVLWNLNAVITVHPVGGCPMGATPAEGVVDPGNGQVHNYPGLHVADGSVMPGTVGANPSMTIAAVANRFADGILREAGLL